MFSRWGSYHGNTLGALDLSGRKPLRRPYEGWLGRFRHVSAAYPYRAGDPGANALGTAEELAAELERAIEAAGPGTVAAFVGEPIVGATLAAAVPPDGYWPAIAEVCRRHGVLLIADEVMTGFGRTGRWFGVDHWGVRPDILVAAKGATSGYWPFGFVAASGAVHDAVTAPGAGFVHGFTYSHHAVGAAVARRGAADPRDRGRSSRPARRRATGCRRSSGDRLAEHPNVGEIRGRGLMVGLELVADRETRAPFPRAARLTETIVRAARADGLLLYSGTGLADGVDGDSILLGPPFVVTDDELDRIADGLHRRSKRPWRRSARPRTSAAAGPADDHQPDQDQDERPEELAQLGTPGQSRPASPSRRRGRGSRRRPAASPRCAGRPAHQRDAEQAEPEQERPVAATRRAGRRGRRAARAGCRR